jgi:predicted amidohydrolase
VQSDPKLLDLEKNIERAINLTAGVYADVFVFPELFLSGYTFADMSEVSSVAQSLEDDPHLSRLIRLSKERNIGICGGYVEESNGRYYNSSFFVGDGTILCNYRKTHLFADEKDYFAPGDTGFSVFEYNGVRYGMMICFDWVFPESARTLALRGAQVILHPANLVLPYCQRAMYARAIENRVFIVTANRVGREKNTRLSNTFTGGSQVVSPTGEYLVTLGENDEAVMTVIIDPHEADNKNITGNNHIFDDRHPEMYE